MKLITIPVLYKLSYMYPALKLAVSQCNIQSVNHVAQTKQQGFNFL